MAYKRKYVAKKKRSFRRRFPARRPKRSFRPRRRHLIQSGFPNKKIVKLRYVEYVSVDAGSATIASQVFLANSIHDPNSTGGGHQPMGTDQWFNVFDHATVIGSKITAQYMHKVTTNATHMIEWGILLSDDGNHATTATDLQELLEQRGVRSRMGGIVYDAAKSMPRMSTQFSAKKFFSKSAIVGDALYRHSISAAPTELAYFELWAVPATQQAVNPDPVTFRVTIDYIVVFTEPKDLIGSSL